MQNQNNREIPEILRGKTFLDPRYDPAFREFFNDAEALTAFLNGILHLEGERRIESLEFSFADPIDFRTPEKQTVVFDIRATTADGRFLDIEMQRAKHSLTGDRHKVLGDSIADKEISFRRRKSLVPNYPDLREPFCPNMKSSRLR